MFWRNRGPEIDDPQCEVLQVHDHFIVRRMWGDRAYEGGEAFGGFWPRKDRHAAMMYGSKVEAIEVAERIEAEEVGRRKSWEWHRKVSAAKPVKVWRIKDD